MYKRSMGENAWTRVTPSSNWSVQALWCWVARAGLAPYRAEKAVGIMICCRNQAAAALPPLHPPGTSLGSQGHCPPIRNTCICHRSILLLKKKKEKNKADEAQASERQSVLFLIQQSYLISASAFQFPDYRADTRCSCSSRRSHRPTAPKLGLEPRSFVSLHI